MWVSWILKIWITVINQMYYFYTFYAVFLAYFEVLVDSQHMDYGLCVPRQTNKFNMK